MAAERGDGRTTTQVSVGLRRRLIHTRSSNAQGAVMKRNLQGGVVAGSTVLAMLSIAALVGTCTTSPNPYPTDDEGTGGAGGKPAGKGGSGGKAAGGAGGKGSPDANG